MTIDPLQRRALIHGGIAAAVTLVVGFGVVASVTGGNADEVPVTPTASSPTSPPPPACAPSWSILPSADLGDLPNQLLGVTALSSAEAWAVGASGDPAAPTSVLIERWDGIGWTAEAGPNPGSQTNELRAVDASGPNDVWAVGRTASGFGDRPLVLRYDGTQWLAMELPDEVTGVLTGVVANSAVDVWVVGYTGDPALSLERAMVLHWDGFLWAVVDLGRAAGVGRSALFDIEAATADELWSVGYLHGRPLVLLFDGLTWSRSQTDVDGTATAIEPVTSSDVWMVGAPIHRFDGAAWTQAAEVRAEGELRSVAAVSPSDVWAVGIRPAGAGLTKSLVVRFDGRAWKVVDGPPAPGADALASVDALPDGTVLGVGYRDVELGRRTLAVRGTTCPAET